MPIKKNRLLFEKSPYLLQHSQNPVDWFPWGEEAFQKAKDEKKPVFLSIGYSTCHWCHVMEKESFEDEEIALLMNSVFVNIKVDREERPDIDAVYMSFCQSMTGQGGWPLTIIMTPDKKPFFAGTYFPKEQRYNRIGMRDIITKVDEAWKSDRQRILAGAEKLVISMNENKRSSFSSSLDKTVFKAAFDYFSNSFDEDSGGFGSAPKFPSPHNLLFLLEYYRETGEKRALKMVETTLKRMRFGGIYDQIGGGFHRYSTDKDWFVPHFEKMLYDQALLIMAYSECYLITKNILFKETVVEMVEYLKREMYSTDGGFFSAEDADSEGEEGKFYLWQSSEIIEHLQADAYYFNELFNITSVGNFQDPFKGGAYSGENIPVLNSEMLEGNEDKLIDLLLSNETKSLKAQLLKARDKRIHPLKDDKILTDWNGLIIFALSKASRIFNNDEFLQMAEKAAKFILSTMVKKNGRLFHRYRNSSVAIEGMIDDYAFMTLGLIELYNSTYKVNYLEKAISFTKILLTNFRDSSKGGFFNSADYGENLVVNLKEIYDGAIPSGNSVILNNLSKLFRLTSDSTYEELALKALRYFSPKVLSFPGGHSMFLLAFYSLTEASTEIVVAGNYDDKETTELVKTIQNEAPRNSTIIFRDLSGDREKGLGDISEIIEFVKGFDKIGGKPSIYICNNGSCKLPVTDWKKALTNMNQA